MKKKIIDQGLKLGLMINLMVSSISYAQDSENNNFFAGKWLLDFSYINGNFKSMNWPSGNPAPGWNLIEHPNRSNSLKELDLWIENSQWKGKIFDLDTETYILITQIIEFKTPNWTKLNHFSGISEDNIIQPTIILTCLIEGSNFDFLLQKKDQDNTIGNFGNLFRVNGERIKPLFERKPEEVKDVGSESGPRYN